MNVTRVKQDSDFQIFLFFALFQEVTTNITIHYKSKKKWNNKLHKSSKMKCAQWPKELFFKIGFWVGHYHVQLTGVDIYIKTRSDVQRSRFTLVDISWNGHQTDTSRRHHYANSGCNYKITTNSVRTDTTETDQRERFWNRALETC